MVDSIPARRADRVVVRSKRRTRAITKRSSEEMVTELEELGLSLRAVYAVAVTAQLALRCQAAEQDLEIADALRDGVCDALGERIRELGDIERRGDRRSRG